MKVIFHKQRKQIILLHVLLVVPIALFAALTSLMILTGIDNGFTAHIIVAVVTSSLMSLVVSISLIIMLRFAAMPVIIEENKIKFFSRFKRHEIELSQNTKVSYKGLSIVFNENNENVLLNLMLFSKEDKIRLSEHLKQKI